MAIPEFRDYSGPSDQGDAFRGGTDGAQPPITEVTPSGGRQMPADHGQPDVVPSQPFTSSRLGDTNSGEHEKRATDDADEPQPLPPTVPPHWTTLYHGTNLGRKEWQGREAELDAPAMTVGPRGLAAVTQQSRDYDARHNADTTAGYSTDSSGGAETEIRVLFPAFHSRQAGHRERVADYSQRYGEERGALLLKKGDKVYWNNREGQYGRHPVVPRETVLDKLDDRIDERGKRVVTYVPRDVNDIYGDDLQKATEAATAAKK